MGRICLARAGAVLFLACQSASAQICRPVAERTGEVGCWIIASQSVGQFAKAETSWHLDVYATRAEAEAAKASGSVVVGSLAKTWLLTIADQGWRPSGGERIAEIGRAGGTPVIVPGGPPMHLTATETEQRRALVLILHDSSKHATTPEHDWVPKGLCKI
jgi:hypothetical protein